MVLTERKQKGFVLLPAFLLVGIAVYYFPALIYRENSDFIHSPYGYMALVLFPVFLGLSLLLWLPATVLNIRGRAAYATMLGVLAILSWFIGNFLFFDRGLLDGREFLKEDSFLYQALEGIGLSVALVALVAAGMKFQKIFKQAVYLLSLMTAGIIIITLFKDPKSYSIRTPDTDIHSFYSLSSKKNILIFLFDTFQSDLFSDILREHPEFRTSLDGFTYFPNTAGVAPTTYLSMPAIHAGTEYSPGTPMGIYYQETVKKDSFMSRLASNGYDSMQLNAIGGCPVGVTCSRSAELINGPWRSTLQDALFLTDISLYRIVPSLLKKYIYNNGDWFLVDTVFRYNRADENNQVLSEIAKNIRIDQEKPAARFLHSFSTHPPAGVDADCNPIRRVRWNRGSAKAQSVCALRLMERVLQELKGNGLYDISLIVILADHGYGYKGELKPTIVQSANPLLLIKPLGMRGHLKTSRKNVFLTDIPQTVCGLIGDCSYDTGQSAFEFDNSDRTRSVMFNQYVWKHAYWQEDIIPVERYLIVGPVRNVLSWYKEVTPDQVNATTLDFSAADQEAVFGFGWGEPERDEEDTVRWAIGPQAQIYLAIPEDRDMVLKLRVHNFFRNKNQRVTLFVDQARIGNVRMQADETRDISFKIPSTFISNSVSRLTFQFSKFNRARWRGRQLAAGFDSLEITHE